MEYYKVVRVYNQELVSVMVPVAFEQCYRVYRDSCGQILTANNGMVFDNKQSAIHFFHDIEASHSHLKGKLQIWECTGKKDKLPKRLLCMADIYYSYEQGRLMPWQAFKKYMLFGGKCKGTTYIPLNAKWPDGTARLRNIKLTERIR